MSLFNGGNGAAPWLADPAHPLGDSRDAVLAPGSVSLAALLASNAASPAVSSSGETLGFPDGAGTSPPSVPGAAAARSAGSQASAGPAAPAAPNQVPATSPATSVAPARPPASARAPAAVHPGAAPVAPSRSQQGVASWLSIASGTCADNAAPMGATLTVTNAAGASVTCIVVSRGPFVTGRVVDLAESTFAKLGSPSQGLVSVTVIW